ncbi:MAG: ABC transporter substrate-binding protein [Chromatiales bacterium]|jgi:NitT/TauT family transport system substrate-binding protein|nr:ABC transporter substrate-binding protein [Chromatiales bacterium]
MRLLTMLLISLVTAASASAATTIKFANDWKWEGPAAPLLVALDRGWYTAAGLDVTMDTGKGSREAIPRVASGTYQMGSADINSLIKFRDKNPELAVTAVMMIYNAPPFAIIGRKSRGIHAPKDLEGKILGAPAPDGAYAQWKAFVRANGIDASKVKIENVGFPVREPMLAAGKVDAITGYSFSSYINLKSKGVGADDISLILMRDHGLDLYGNVIIVNPDFAKSNPADVKAFVAATIRGFQATAKDPVAAVKHVLNHNDVAREAVELERLQMALAQNIITDEVRANGFGGVDAARLERSMDQIADTYTFTNRPKGADVFDMQYLPPKSERMMP